jgi:thiol-disulfide isomerase/thioredoxin
MSDSADKKSVVYIGAEWCGPCKSAKPRVIEICKKYGIDLAIYDYDEDLTEDDKSNIKKLPTVRVIHDTKVVQEFITQHHDQLEKWLIENVRVKPTDDF